MITNQDLPALNQALQDIASQFKLKQEAKEKWDKAIRDKKKFSKQYHQAKDVDVKGRIFDEIINRFLDQ